MHIMGYFRDEQDLGNYLNRIARKHNISAEDLAPGDAMTGLFWLPRLLERFTWHLRKHPEILLANNFQRWCVDEKYRREIEATDFRVDAPEKKGWVNGEWVTFPQELFDSVAHLARRPGCYIFSSEEDETLYIGKSIDLATRLVQSLRERWSDLPPRVKISYVETHTQSNACPVEALLISQLKPSLNGTGRHDDDCTLPWELPYPIETVPVGLDLTEDKVNPGCFQVCQAVIS